MRIGGLDFMGDEQRLAVGAASALRAGAAALLLLTAGGLLDGARAGGLRVAQRSEPTISLTSAITAEPATQVALAIRVGPPDAVPANSFIRLRGLPPSVSLSEGHAISPGSWAIPLFGLPTLKANIPAGVSGRSELAVTLVSVDGAVLAEGRTVLVVAPPVPPPPPVRRPDTGAANSLVPPMPVPAGRPDRGGQARPELSSEERTHAEKMIAQGERYLSQGNVAIARQFFQRAADAGYAQGAVRLAATYDPSELERLQVQGVVPDRAEARKWYERAKELGAPEAEERLARLGGS